MRAAAAVQAGGVVGKNVSCVVSAAGRQDRSETGPSDVVVVVVALEGGQVVVASPGSYDHRARLEAGTRGLARQLSA
jgi:hypothetical protein